MKKTKLFLVVAILLVVPFFAMAFSWDGLMFWKKPTPKIIALPAIEKVVPTKTSAEKLTTWEKAFKTKDFTEVKNNEAYLNLTESDMNFFLEQGLKDTKNPPVRNAYINLMNNEVEITGYMLKPWEGNFILRMEPEYSSEQIVPKITKAKYKYFRVPSYIANKMLSEHLDPVLDFINVEKGMQVLITDDKFKVIFPQ
jgi:hypothetical protein